MFNIELLSDRVAATSLEKRRNREMLRQERIFNAKVRTIGVDKEALDVQVKEKKKQAEAEEESLNAYAADMLRNDKAACLLNSLQVKEERKMEKAIAHYRQHFQQPWCQREYDLNDPNRCKKEDRDGAQMMLPGLVGEDPGSEARLKRQKEQLREWLIQQQCERAAASHQQRLEEHQYDHSRVSMDNKALQLEKIEQERKKAVALATKDYNLAKWAETEGRRRRQRELNEEDNQADILNHLQGEVVGEDATLGVLGVPSLWPSSDKRAPPQNLQQIIQFQKYQTEEKTRMELDKKQEDERQDRFRLDSARTALLLERQQARLNKQLRRDLDSTNVKLAEVQKQQKQAREKESIHSLDSSFLSKFNTSSR